MGEIPSQTLADVNAHGTNDRQGKEAGNEQGDGGGDNGAGGFGNDIIDPLVDITQGKYAEDDGNDRTRIVEYRNGQDACKHKVADLACLGSIHHGGVHQSGGNGNGQILVGLEFFCGRCGNEERQEGKHAAGKHINDLIGIGSIGNHAQSHQTAHQALDHTGTGNGGHDGAEYAGHHIHEPGNKVFLFFRLGRSCDILLQIQHLQGDVVIFMDAGAKHDLQLAFGKLHANDTIQRLDSILLDLAGIFELKAQTGHAMPSVHNIVFAADILDDFCDDFSLFHKGEPPSSVSFFLDCVPKRKSSTCVVTLIYHGKISL